MDRVFSARVDEAVLDEMNRVAGKLALITLHHPHSSLRTTSIAIIFSPFPSPLETSAVPPPGIAHERVGQRNGALAPRRRREQ